MAALPTTEDIRRAREQAEAGVNATFDAVKSPLLAALGAVDAAARTATVAFNKARSETAERTEVAQTRLQRTLTGLQDRVSDLAKEVSELRRHLEPGELRKLAEQYGDLAHNVYTSLIERGEEVLSELRKRPQVRHALESVEAGVDTAQERLENAVRDLNATVDELRSRFALTSRSVGERVARETEDVATAAGEKVQDAAKVSRAATEAGDEVATTTRSTARAVAERAAPPRKPANRRPGDNNTRRS